MGLATIGLIGALVIIIAVNTIGVIFFLGRFYRVKGPGLIILIPFIQTMTKVDLRVIVMDVPTQDVISRDNVSVKVNAVIYFRIVDPEKASGEFKRRPDRDELPPDISEQLVVELYSK